MNNQQRAMQEIAIRKLEEKYKPEREDLYEYIKTYFKLEKNKEFQDNWHNYVLADALMRVYEWEVTRLIINIPPRMSKTEFVSKCFPTWVLWKRPETKFIVTWYSSTLTETFSWEARDYSQSKTYKKIFPRSPKLKDDQNTKKWWENTSWWQYYAMGSWWTITWIGADIIIVDDPLNADDKDSEVKRIWVNNWYHNVLESRLNDKINGAIIIIMQRLHDDDLVWHLLEQELDLTGDKWEKIVIPAIQEETSFFDTRYGVFKRIEWQLLCESRLPNSFLQLLKTKSKETYSSQYQQNPIDKDSQEFHQEWFKYDDIPSGWRVFTTVDPAFSKKDSADDSAITTAKFIWDKLYILEQTAGKFNPAELEDKIIYHTKKWKPEKIWVEAVAAQVTIWFSLRNRLKVEKLYQEVVDIRQSGDKEAKIRSLIPLYRNWQIIHTTELSKLENQLIRFPRWKHDDCPDSLQLMYYMYEMTPNTPSLYKIPKIKYDKYWTPVVIK